MNIDKYKKCNKSTKYNSYKLYEIMNSINIGDYAIPKFQRDYVWTRDKIITFLNSILEDEPFGFIIKWKNNCENNIDTKNEIIRKFSKDNKHNWYIIDGQQRLTSLFSIFNNRDILNLPTKRCFTPN